MTTHIPRRGFTLVELMIVIAIITIIAGMSMAALAGAAEEGRRQRAAAQIQKIDQLISEKWNSYRYRQLPFRPPIGTQPAVAALQRLSVMRDLQRMEMPDRLTDINDPQATPMPVPAATWSYRRKLAAAAPDNTYEQAECLYLIIAEMRDGDRPALDFFLTAEIGDVDGDGLYEILDPWGTPILFLRWAPGYSKALASDLNGHLVAPAPQPTVVVDTFQIPDGTIQPDAFDPLKVDPRWNSFATYGFYPFKLRPLIISAGPDKVYDIYVDEVLAANKLHYAATPVCPNDPFTVRLPNGNPGWVGQPIDYANDGLQHGDNITNHGLSGKDGGSSR